MSYKTWASANSDMLTFFLQALLVFKKKKKDQKTFIQVKIENATKYLKNLINNVGLLTKVCSELVVEVVGVNSATSVYPGE